MIIKKITFSILFIIFLANILSLSGYSAIQSYPAISLFENGLGIQGKNLWYYQQWNGISYSNLSWNNSAQKWYGTQTHLAISGQHMHPEDSLDAVRKWVSPCDGNVRIYGNVKKADTGGGDGVTVTIKRNTNTVWGQHVLAYNDSIGLNYDFSLNLNAGDAIYFIVSKNSTIYNDTTTWNPNVDFSPISSGTSVALWDFTSSTETWSSNWHTTVSASGGYLNATVTDSDPSIKSLNNLNIDITKSGLVKIKYKNATNSPQGLVFFTTIEDPTFTASKSKSFTVIANDPNYTEYIVDMSGVYGWIGKLKQIRLDLSEASSGSYSVDYVKLVAGGENIAPLSLLDKEIIYNNNTLKNVLDLDYYADSSFGIKRNSDASYDFYTANGGSPIGQHSTITHGTLELPANSITYKWKDITGVPAGIDYTSVGPVYQDPNDVNTLISFLHLERQYVVNSVHYFDASIGLAITKNNGSTWTFCGEIIDHDIAPNETLAAGYDIGAGTFTIVNENGIDYFYVYAIDHSVTNPYLRALSVSRAPVLEVLNAAKNNSVTSFLKYYNGSFTQPGMNGSFTNIFNSNTQMNFMSISYNTYINKYIMAYTSTSQWGSNNWSDISLLISDSPTDFYNNTKEIIIDASNKYTQYPTIIGLGNDNSQTQSQENFYVYYMQWENDQVWGSDTNLVRKMIILDKPSTEYVPLSNLPLDWKSEDMSISEKSNLTEFNNTTQSSGNIYYNRKINIQDKMKFSIEFTQQGLSNQATVSIALKDSLNPESNSDSVLSFHLNKLSNNNISCQEDLYNFSHSFDFNGKNFFEIVKTSLSFNLYLKNTYITEQKLIGIIPFSLIPNYPFSNESAYLNISLNDNTFVPLTYQISDLYSTKTQFINITFEPCDIPVEIVAENQIFPQFFNYANIPSQKVYWKPFYINDYNQISNMQKHPTISKFVIPNKTDINQYAQISESIGNSNHTAQDFYTGDYFIAPFDGIVKINSIFSTQSGDGVGIAVYKNDFNTLISARQVFNSVNASTGKNLIVNNVNVKRGDKLIFLYDKNGDVYGDVFVVNRKQIEYTYMPPVCFDYSVSGLNILTGLSEKTSVASFSQGVYISSGVTYEVSNVNVDFVGTGTTVTVTANNTTTTYTVVLYGDVDGDGEILLDDLILVRDNLLESDTLNPTAQLAGDIYGEGSITLNSLVGLMTVVSEAGTINQNC